MNKIKSFDWRIDIFNILVFTLFILFTLFVSSFISRCNSLKGYSFFIEFNNAYGIQEGTYVRMRGMNIGHVKNIKMDMNSILVLVHINSQEIIIPRNSIIETSQTGLLNDTIVDIAPLTTITIDDYRKTDVFAKSCSLSSFICHLDYLEGDRGLNYDDLIRAATRISQRFDDPSFFSIFYLFLQNGLELSDDIINIAMDISNMLSFLYRAAFITVKSS